jgi:hypothetical protein
MPIWFPTTKVKNRAEICAYRLHVIYRWKALNKGYNFALDLASIEGLHKKLWLFKMPKISILGISRLTTWESQNKMTFGCSPRG